MNLKIAALFVAASSWGFLAPRAPASGIPDALQEKPDPGKPEKEQAGKQDPGKEKAGKEDPGKEKTGKEDPGKEKAAKETSPAGPEKKKDPGAFLKEKPAADLDGDGKLSLEEVLAL
ncbi:MAG: hypothetical protein L0323_24075, partial [Planctomycetes bacterium]|nr:hypothetical protein [Planctomycetota bacterium]